MGDRDFNQLLKARWAEGKFLCVGLDSARSKLPKSVVEGARVGNVNPQFAFNRRVVSDTADLVCAFKPNSAFYEEQGDKGIRALIDTVEYIHEHAPGVPVIVDAKRGDIDSTNDGYVKSVFDTIGADAITIHPTLGYEAMRPFLDRSDKGIIVLCRTSNKGAQEFQDAPVTVVKSLAGNYYSIPDEYLRESGLTVNDAMYLEQATMPLYQFVAHRVAQKWNYNGNCGVVVGATYPEELGIVRVIVGDIPILIPGVGAQGGSAQQAVENGANSRGTGIVINNSRGIIFASGKDEYSSEAVRSAAQKTHDEITTARQAA